MPIKITRNPESPKIITVPTDKELNRIFKRNAQELGDLVCSWNQLQESLAELFVSVLEYKRNDKRLDGTMIAIWYSTNNDRSQREMLRAATKSRLKNSSHAPKKMYEDITWIIDKANALSDKRNDAVHAPMHFITDATGTNFRSVWMSRNPRAIKLKNKDLLQEFIWYRASAETLTRYARQMTRSLWRENEPWPDRPTLPQLVQARRSSQPHKQKKR